MPSPRTPRARPILIPHGTEITVDARGRVVRESGVGIGCPPPLGRLGSLFLEPLPEGAAQELPLDGEILVDDEWPAPGGDPGPPMFHGGPGRPLPQLTARRTGTSRITSLTDTSASLATTLEIASILQSGPTPRLTAEVLRNFGPAAEPAALRLLGERHAYTRRLACELLGHIGSDACLEALHEAMVHPDPQVSQAATEALRTVRSRKSTSP